MPYTDSERLTAVQTAIDAIIDAASGGEYTASYQVGSRMWRGATFADLLAQLRAEENRLRLRVKHATMTGGGRAVARFENEPQ